MDCAPPVRAREARSISPRGRITRPRGGGSVSGNGRSVPRCARPAEPQQVLRECPMTPLRVPSQGGGCGVSSCDRGREHGFGAMRLPALRFVRTASGSARPRPRLQRHAPRLGGFIRDRGAPRSPRGHKNPRGSRLAVCSMGLHRIRCGSSCQWRGVCPRHRDCGDSGTGLRPFRRPRRRQPTTLPLAARWMAAPYHAVTRAARAIFLSRSLPPLARRPILPPVTTPLPHPHPVAGRVVTGGTRAAPHLSSRRESNARGASHRPRRGRRKYAVATTSP